MKRYHFIPLTTIVSLLLIVLSACTGTGGKGDKTHNPLHDSINNAITKMQWEEYCRLMKKGLEAANTEYERNSLHILQGNAYYYFGRAKDLRQLLDEIAPPHSTIG